MDIDIFLGDPDVRRKAISQVRFAVRDPQVALDVVQDCSLRLAESYSDRPYKELDDLFFRIVQNAIRDFYRREKTKRAVFAPTPLEVLDEDGFKTSPLDNIPSSTPEPSQNVELSQLIGLLHDQMRKLPMRQREILINRYWLEMTSLEAGRIMGCTEGSAKTHWFRATRNLAEALKKVT